MTGADVYELERFRKELGAEVEDTMRKHSTFASAHEAYAVILEELDEFWEQVRLREEKRDLQCDAQGTTSYGIDVLPRLP